MDVLACKICLRRFKTTCLLKRHMTSHLEEEIYISDKRATGSTKCCFSKVHTRTNTKKPYKCSHCNRTFVQSCHLKEHYRVQSGEKPFVCVTCGKAFIWKNNLNIHKRIHSAEKPYICKVCGKAFKRNDNLNVHQKLHSGDKPYTCKTCGKSYIQKRGLNKHEEIHREEKLYVCKTRGKEFTESGNLKTDNKIHGEPHISTTRRKMFKHISNLKVDENLDNGQKRNECNACGKTFAQRQSLRRHERLHHKVKPDTTSLEENSVISNVNIPDKIDGVDGIYTCSICSMSFSKSAQLDNHKETHQIKDSDQYASIGFINAEYFDKSLNSKKEDGIEIFPDLFGTNSIKSIMETNVSPALLSLDSRVEIQELTQLNFEISADNLHTVYNKSQPDDLGLMSIEELNNPHKFFL